MHHPAGTSLLQSPPPPPATPPLWRETGRERGRASATSRQFLLIFWQTCRDLILHLLTEKANLLCRSTPGTQSAPSQSAAASEASRTPASSPHALSLWQILCWNTHVSPGIYAEKRTKNPHASTSTLTHVSFSVMVIATVIKVRQSKHSLTLMTG